MLTLDGNVMLTERDEFIYDEMITHVPMSVHKNAKDILVIGAGDGGVVRELTRYDRVERIDLVEMDPQVIEACRAYLPGNACRMDDRRVHIYYENALKFIRKCEEEYDLIIVDSSDPFGPSEGLFTREFYGNCFNALRADGIMVNQQGSPFYAEDADRHAAQPQAHRQHLPDQPGVSGTHPYLCGGLLAVRLCQQKISSHQRYGRRCVECAEHAHPLLHDPAACRCILPAGVSGGNAARSGGTLMLHRNVETFHRLRQQLSARQALFCTAHRLIPPPATVPARGSAPLPCGTKATGWKPTAPIRTRT